MTTKIMGILNITPDSFSDGGKFFDPAAALAQAEKMIADGADIVDIGGESTRPSATPVSSVDELARVIPVIDALRKNPKNSALVISIDTQKPEVAEAALAHGANMVNDVTGLRDPAMRAVVAQHNVPVVIMHMQGEPRTMQKDPNYGDVVKEIKTFFTGRVAEAEAAGIARANIILDPGIGFGKTVEHNLLIIKHLREFVALGFPVLVGPSRKSFIGTLSGGLAVEERLEGTLAAVAVAIMNGASIVRVHDVKEAKRVVQIVDAILSA
jgi:dihydropteroate synthase